MSVVRLLVVCYTAVFSVVTQRSSPLTAAENRTTFLSLCVCGLTNKPIMALGREHASQFSTNQSIVAEFRRALCFQATKRLICKKVCFKRSRKFQVKRRFDRHRKILPGSVGSSCNLTYRMCSLCYVKTKLSRVLSQKAIL